MTIVRLHGLLGREYGNRFRLNIKNPKNVLDAIECNRRGFIKRVTDLQKEGFGYDIIVNKKTITSGEEMESFESPSTIDLVPIIGGSSGAELLWIFEKLLVAVFFAAITYALTPKPEVEALETEASLSQQSLIFSNRANIAAQGSPVPVGYGRLLVGTHVIQATIRSYPQFIDPEAILTDGALEETVAWVSPARQNAGGRPRDADPPGPNPDPYTNMDHPNR
jgi:predicted phage tail protein